MKPMYITNDNHLLELVETPIAQAFIKTRKLEVRSPTVIPTVKKITKDEWNTIVGFLQWVFNEFKSEALLYGLYSTQEKKWEFIVPKQVVSRAAVETEDFSQLKEGYELIFSIHTHADMSAFQSGTDHKDEMDGYGAGFHITLGNMDKATMSIHCRSKLVKAFFDEEGFLDTSKKAIVEMSPFSPWHLIETSINTKMPFKLQTDLFEFECLTERDYEFPSEWAEMVEEKKNTVIKHGEIVSNVFDLDKTVAQIEKDDESYHRLTYLGGIINSVLDYGWENPKSPKKTGDLITTIDIVSMLKLDTGKPQWRSAIAAIDELSSREKAFIYHAMNHTLPKSMFYFNEDDIVFLLENMSSSQDALEFYELLKDSRDKEVAERISKIFSKGA